MSMSKQDYLTIASALHDNITDDKLAGGRAASRHTVSRIAVRIADVLERSDPRFDRKRFFATCNVHGWWTIGRP